ncbi:MAG: MarR family transcriptional regulator [Syntrophorhabdales bacterium]|jgi:DNA-binding MarR family transcriptional regulator
MKRERSSREFLGFWLYRAHTQASSLLRRTFQAHGYDLTPEQWGVLRALRNAEGVNQSQLGENTFKDRHNITRILDLLEKRGLVERRIDEGDRRAYRVFLTEAGRKEQKKLQGLVKSHQEALFEGLKPEELAGLRRIFEHIVRNIERKV